MTAPSARAAKIRRLHALAHAAGLSEELYRDKLERATGQRSCAQLSDDEIDRALKSFRSPSLHPHAQKAKAIWLGLYNLGAVAGTDAALDAFAQRQTGAAKLIFVSARDARRLTEGLKAMAARESWDIPSDDPGGMGARLALVLAQWKKLHAAGAVRVADTAALMWWARGQNIVSATAYPHQWKRHELDLAAKKLGLWLRRALLKSAGAA